LHPRPDGALQAERSGRERAGAAARRALRGGPRRGDRLARRGDRSRWAPGCLGGVRQPRTVALVGRLPELVGLPGLPALAQARATRRSAADCDAMVQAAPHALASYRCYWDLAHTGRRMEAERALEAILRREPENPGALHFLGLCRDDRGLYPEVLFRR